jgi:4-amino-4-deoxy-L-arabinose transferase-like glycosyltransferase
MSGPVEPNERTALLIVVGFLFVYLGADLSSQSLALDGLVYANVAKLLVAGEGSIWALPFYDTSFPVFADHPPLGMFMLSIWMQVVGDAFWVEKAFAALNTLVVIMLIGWLIRITKTPTPSWWVILAFAVMPVATYTMKNNFLETQLLVPILVAVGCGCLAWTRSMYAIPMGACVLGAVLIKGPVGLFPLGAVPLALWWYHGEFRQAFVVGAVASVSFATLAAVLVTIYPEAITYAQSYANQQLLPSVSGARGVEHGRAYAVAQLAVNTVAASIVLGVIARTWTGSRRAGFWMIIALAAALPLLVSARQYRHYLLPALPFLALALATSIPAPRLPAHGAVRAVAGAALIGAISTALWHFDRPGDHADTLSDTQAIADHAPVNAVGYCRDDRTLRLRAYLYRRHGIKTSPHSPSSSEWVVCEHSPSRSSLGGPLKAPLELAPKHTLWRLPSDND